jgi:hypothetical protein
MVMNILGQFNQDVGQLAKLLLRQTKRLVGKIILGLHQKLGQFADYFRQIIVPSTFMLRRPVLVEVH